MAYVKRIVCLANSVKTGGSCIAGKEVLAKGYGGWIRPVSARPTAEVRFSEYRYQNNESPELLDIIDVPLLKAAPQHHQTENHVITAGRWLKQGALPWNQLEQLRDRPASLWINSDSTIGGRYNCMSPAQAAMMPDSLFLLKMKSFIVVVSSNTWEGKTRKTYRGEFDYKGVRYKFNLTDPAARRAFASKTEGDYPLNDVYLCISLTETYAEDGRCHKLVAAVISDPPL